MNDSCANQFQRLPHMVVCLTRRVLFAPVRKALSPPILSALRRGSTRMFLFFMMKRKFPSDEKWISLFKMRGFIPETGFFLIGMPVAIQVAMYKVF